MRLARRHQRVEHLAGRRDRNMQFPAEFADIGDAQRPHRRAGNLDLAHMAEREGGVRHVGLCHRRQHVAGFRPHQRQRAEILGHVDQPGIEILADMVADPGQVMRAETRCR